MLERQEIAGGTGGNVYVQFEAACDRLQGRVLEIRLEDQGKRRKINWLHHVEYNDGLGTVTLRFHDDLKDALLQLRERFSMIPLKTVFRFRGGYAIRWYESLQSPPGPTGAKGPTRSGPAVTWFTPWRRPCGLSTVRLPLRKAP